MTVKELIAMLSRHDSIQDDEVLIWNGDCNDWMPVTGMTYSGGEPVQLYSDED